MLYSQRENLAKLWAKMIEKPYTIQIFENLYPPSSKRRGDRTMFLELRKLDSRDLKGQFDVKKAKFRGLIAKIDIRSLCGGILYETRQFSL